MEERNLIHVSKQAAGENWVKAHLCAVPGELSPSLGLPPLAANKGGLTQAPRAPHVAAHICTFSRQFYLSFQALQPTLSSGAAAVPLLGGLTLHTPRHRPG